MRRRVFLQSALAASLASAVQGAAAGPKHILLRSSWQVVNIGDIAHTPGVLALLEKFHPEAKVTLWASGDLSEEVMQMEHKRFPSLTIVKGTIGADGKASNAPLAEAIAAADFLLHGSGPSLVAAKDVADFARHTGKPYGVYGITYGGGTDETRQTLTRAKFAFFRDSVSLAKAKSDGVACPRMEFAPDGAFAVDLRNDAAAERFLQQHDLLEGKFLCCLSRLRYTPYWEIRRKEMTDEDRRRHAVNEKHAEQDHAPLREAIAAVVRTAGLKVLLCPEDQSQMAVGKRHLYDPLPDEVKRSVVWREKFWLTDEALSTYVRSAGLFGSEMHSPIMCIGNGIPAIVCRFPEQTSKGFMWRDIGLGEWLFDLDQPADRARVAATVLAMVQQREATREKVAAAQQFVRRRQQETMAALA